MTTLSLPYYSTKFFNPHFRSTCIPFFIKKKSGANPEKQCFQKRISVYLRMRNSAAQNEIQNTFSYPSLIGSLFTRIFHESWKRNFLNRWKHTFFNFHFAFDVSQSVKDRLESNFFKFFHLFFLNNKERGKKWIWLSTNFKVLSISSTFQLTKEFLLSVIIRHSSNYENRLEQRKNSVCNYFILQHVYPRGI